MLGLRLLIFCLIGAYSVMVCLGQPVPATASGSTTLTEADLRKLFSDATKRVNEFYKTEGFPIPVPSTESCSFKYQLNSSYQQTTGVFSGTEQALVSCEMLAASGKFVEFHNYAAAHAFQRSPMSETPPAAKWTNEHAIELAAKFADIFIKPWGVGLGKPTARYNILGHDVDKKTGKLLTAPGQWTVFWMEQTLSGIPYRIGGVTVDLSEEYGPDYLTIHFPAQYEDEHITPISKEKALIEARKGLDKILAWEPAKESLGHVQVLDTPPPFALLMIVQPNHMTEQKNLYAAATSNPVKARLAWVVTYKVNAGAGNGIISVYIDAKDGSFLGGYF
jgi:hypothetical protein